MPMRSPSLSPMTAAELQSTRLLISAANELTIQYADGQRHAIHPLWLRERCQDASTLDLRTGQRLQDPSDFDPQLALIAVTQIEPGRLQVRFSDGHEADFLERDILAEAALPVGDHDLPAPRLWDSTLQLSRRFRWSSQPSDQELADQYEIHGTPTMIMFLNGQEVGRVEGAQPDDLLRALTAPFDLLSV